jgi:uncharacterized protein YjbI with pentapeptide repeats
MSPSGVPLRRLADRSREDETKTNPSFPRLPPLRSDPKRQLSGLVLTAIVGAVAIAGILWLVGAAYGAWWTGFNSYYAPDGHFYPAKSLWDWMQLCLVPASLAAASLAVTASLAHSTARQKRSDYREHALVRCVALVDDVVVKESFDHPSDPAAADFEDPQIGLVRAHILATLRVLDPSRKGRLIYFLHAANLLGYGSNNPPRVTLPLADLRAMELADENLDGVWLEATNLQGANLRGAQLRDAQFDHADLSQASLAGADLIRTGFDRATLCWADLRGAKTEDPKTGDRTLWGSANLSHAKMDRALRDRLRNERIAHDRDTPES